MLGKTRRYRITGHFPSTFFDFTKKGSTIMATKLVKATTLFLGTLLLGTIAFAQTSPTAEYSADSVMETSEGAMKGRVYIAPGKERREMKMGGDKSVQILRHDKKVSWMVMPEEKMYMEMKHSATSQRNDDLSEYSIEQSVVGKEPMNGVETTKSKIIMTGKDGSKMGGFMWTSRENILVKLDAISIDKGSKDRFKIELTNIKIGRQDPALFDIPKDFEKMDMPGMDMESIKKMMK
jgi:Domain of unknown function (DUF4412)